MIELDTIKWTKSLQKTLGDQYLVAMCLDIYNNVFFGKTGVFNRQIEANQFRKNRKRYANFKAKKFGATQPWIRTGTFKKNMLQKMKTLNDGGKKVIWRGREKKSSLEVHRAIGKAKGDKSKNEETKRAIFWGAQRKRSFRAFEENDVQIALDTADRYLDKIFREVGVKE
jgi:hypothetical protein